MPYWIPWLVSSIAHIHQLPPKSWRYRLSTTVHVILKASSGVAAKLRTSSQPVPLKLTDKIGEQATPSNPGSIHNHYPWSPCRCRVFIIHDGTIHLIKKDTMDYPNSYKWINQGSKRKMNSIQINTYKMMNFTVTKNIKTDMIQNTVTNAKEKKT